MCVSNGASKQASRDALRVAMPPPPTPEGVADGVAFDGQGPVGNNNLLGIRRRTSSSSLSGGPALIGVGASSGASSSGLGIAA